MLACSLACSQTNGVFEFQIKNAAGEEQCWTIDLKKVGNVYQGKAQPKSDVTIVVSGMSSALSDRHTMPTPRATLATNSLSRQMTHSSILQMANSTAKRLS